MMMAGAAGIRQLVDAPRLQTGLRGHDPEVVAENATDFGVVGDPGHVTANTVGKGVDGMGVFVCVPRMTEETLPGTGPYRLELGRG